MNNEAKKIFLEFGEKYRKAVREDDYLESFRIILSGIKIAKEKNDGELMNATLSIVMVLHTSMANKYQIDKKYLEVHAYLCSLCGKTYRLLPYRL